MMNKTKRKKKNNEKQPTNEYIYTSDTYINCYAGYGKHYWWWRFFRNVAIKFHTFEIPSNGVQWSLQGIEKHNANKRTFLEIHIDTVRKRYIYRSYIYFYRYYYDYYIHNCRYSIIIYCMASVHLNKSVQSLRSELFTCKVCACLAGGVSFKICGEFKCNKMTTTQ